MIRKILDSTPTLFAPDKAVELALTMGAEDPDWTYAADHDPKGIGYSRVVITDEDGEFVAYL